MIFIKSCILDLRVMRTAPGTIVTKEDLEKTVEILLTETDTLRFFNLPTVMVSVESEEAEKVRYLWFKCLHCFCNLNAKIEVLIFVPVLGDSWINTVVYVSSEIIYVPCEIICIYMYVLFLKEEPIALPYSLQSR